MDKMYKYMMKANNLEIRVCMAGRESQHKNSDAQFNNAEPTPKKFISQIQEEI
jgi:hypothetical protein